MTTEYPEVVSLSFAKEGVAVQYVMLPTDVHSNGMIVQRSLTVPVTEDTFADIKDLHEKVADQVLDWLEDVATSPSVDPRDLDDDEDDDRGMGE